MNPTILRIPVSVLVLLVIGVQLPGAGAIIDACPPGVARNPLQNDAFELGIPPEVLTDEEIGEALRTVGGIVPGLTEDNAQYVAPLWFVKIARDPRVPFSDVKWRETVGAENTGGVIIRYDTRDSGHQALSLVQPLGHPIAGSAWCGATQVRFDVRTTADVDVVAHIYTREGANIPFQSSVVTATPGGATADDVPVSSPSWTTYYAQFPPGILQLTRFELLISGGPAAEDASIRVDNVAVIGSRFL